MSQSRPDDATLVPKIPQHKTAWGWADVVFLLLLATFWVYHVTPIVAVEKRHGGDTLRDLASAHNIQQGQVLADPAYRGHTIWYPPLSPVMVAGVSSLLSITPTECYIWSQLLFNWMIPAGLFLIVSLQWGRRAAMASTIALLLALPWWQSSVCRGQASMHAVIWAWAALLLYGSLQRRGGLGWAAACGLLQGVAFWHHPLLPAVLAIGFVVQTAWACLRLPKGADAPALVRKSTCQEAVTIGMTLLVAAPILYLMLHGPVLNPEPRVYVADELRTAEFPLMRNNVWIWAMGLVGLASSVKGKDFGARLLVVTLALCFLGQVPGYAEILEVPILCHLPVVVPHEFQLAFQLGWAVCVGVGIEKTVTFIAAKLGTSRARADASTLLSGLAFILTGAWGWFGAETHLRRFLGYYGPQQAEFREAAEWIRSETDVDDVFMCDADLAFAWLGPRTGRKVWVTGKGHSNPRVDWSGRMRTLEEMSALASPQEFWRMARGRGVNYCIPSPGWLPKVLTDGELGPVTVPAYLKPVFVAGKVHILRVVAEPVDQAPDSRASVR